MRVTLNGEPIIGARQEQRDIARTPRDAYSGPRARKGRPNIGASLPPTYRAAPQEGAGPIPLSRRARATHRGARTGMGGRMRAQRRRLAGRRGAAGNNQGAIGNSGKGRLRNMTDNNMEEEASTDKVNDASTAAGAAPELLAPVMTAAPKA